MLHSQILRARSRDFSTNFSPPPPKEDRPPEEKADPPPAEARHRLKCDFARAFSRSLNRPLKRICALWAVTCRRSFAANGWRWEAQAWCILMFWGMSAWTPESIRDLLSVSA